MTQNYDPTLTFLIVILVCLGLLVSTTTTANIWGYIGPQGQCVCPSQSMAYPSTAQMSMKMSSGGPPSASHMQNGSMMFSQHIQSSRAMMMNYSCAGNVRSSGVHFFLYYYLIITIFLIKAA